MVKLQEVLSSLDLLPLPIEGGYFRVTYRSPDRVPAAALPADYDNERTLAGAIYFLATAEQFSAMHRLRGDENYYFHGGDPLELLVLEPDGGGSVRVLGIDFASAQQPQYVVPRHCWQGSRPLPGGEHGFSLLSTSMAPAFDEADVTFAGRAELIAHYPQYANLITTLTRG